MWLACSLPLEDNLEAGEEVFYFLRLLASKSGGHRFDSRRNQWRKDLEWSWMDTFSLSFSQTLISWSKVGCSHPVVIPSFIIWFPLVATLKRLSHKKIWTGRCGVVSQVCSSCGWDNRTLLRYHGHSHTGATNEHTYIVHSVKVRMTFEIPI